MLCPQCDSGNDYGAEKCWNCGAALPVFSAAGDRKPAPRWIRCCTSAAIALAIVTILLMLIIRNFLVQMDKRPYRSCIEALEAVKVGQEMYMNDHGTYTTDKDLLAIYMIPGCTDPTGSSQQCAGLVNWRVSVQKNRTSWEILPGETGDLQSYYLTATSRDKYDCKICVSPDSYLPTNFKDCRYRKEMKCPKKE